MHIANCKNRSIHVNYCEHSQTPCISFNRVSTKNSFSSSKKYLVFPSTCYLHVFCVYCVQAVMLSDFNEWGSAKKPFIHQLFSNFKERLALRCETQVNCGRELIAMPSMWYPHSTLLQGESLPLFMPPSLQEICNTSHSHVMRHNTACLLMPHC